MGQWSREGWHGLTFEQKQTFVKDALYRAFSTACELKDTPKNIFWKIILLDIHRDNEKNWETFLSLNQWIITDQSFVKNSEIEFGLNFEEIPDSKKCPKLFEKIFKSILSNKIYLYGGAVIVLILIIIFFIRRK
jgi:hypothetical protein